MVESMGADHKKHNETIEELHIFHNDSVKKRRCYHESQNNH